MSTPFLVGFSESVVARLLDGGLVEVEPGAEARVVLFVANWLGSVARGGSLLSNVEKALLACPEVTECYADLDDLPGLVEELRR